MGVGRYSSDFALDVRSCVRAVARLPFEPIRLLEVISEAEPAAAGNAEDPDHTIFWLTVADQFARLGIDCQTARERALTIISEGADLAAMTALGMGAKSLAKRRTMLEQLRGCIAAPLSPAKSRAVLKAPQKLLLEVGEVLIYPVGRNSGGGYYEPINPYAVGKDWAWVKAWRHDGWGALVIAERGLLFDYLAWYRPVVVSSVLTSEPTITELASARTWVLRQGGTLTARHRDNMQMKAVGRIEIDRATLDHFFPDRRIPVGPVVNDVSLSNGMKCAEREPDDPFWDNARMAFRPCMTALSDIAVGAGVSDTAPNPHNVTGRWQGKFSYDGGSRAPTSFLATLNEVLGLLRGTVDGETSATDTAGRPMFAVVEGRRDGRAVRFVKRYISATTRDRPIEYQGQVDESGQRLAGRWSIRERSGGDFVMTRPNEGQIGYAPPVYAAAGTP